MSGQNKRINNTIMTINKIISDKKLDRIHPIRFLEDSRDFDSEYEYVIDKISEVIGELRGLTLDIAGRTEETRIRYQKDIKKLDELRAEMRAMRKENI